MRQFGVLAVILELLWIGYLFSNPTMMGADAIQVWFQAERIRTDAPVYQSMPDYGPDVQAGDREYPLLSNSPYLPPLASVVALFPPFSWESFVRFSHVFLLVMLWAYACILGRLQSQRWSLPATFTAHGLLLLWPGTLLMLAAGNIEPMLWCLFGLAMLYPSARGAALTTMAAVKVHAVWPLLFLTGRRFKETSRSAIPAAVVLLSVTFLAMGIGDTMRAAADWLRNIPSAVGQGTFYARNFSVSFFPIRVARWVGWDYSGGPLPSMARLWLLAASVSVPLAAGWFSRRRSPEAQTGVTMTAALLASPLCWMGYLTALYAPIAWWIGRDGCQEKASQTSADG